MLKYVFSFFVFTLCLASVEVFFRINKQYHFFAPRPYVSYSEDQKIKFLKASPEIVKKLREKVRQLPPIDYAAAAWLDDHRSDRFGLTTPTWPGFYVKNYRPENPTSIKIEEIAKVGGRLVYDVNYNFDKNGFRVVPGQELSPRKKNIVFIGCSFAFGQGLNDDQTQEYFLKQMMPQYNIINLGVPAAGLQEIFEDINLSHRVQNINNNGGVVIYEMISDHFERTFCFFDCYRRDPKWIIAKDQYVIDENGKPHSLGPFATSRPVWYNKMMFFLGASEFLKFVGFKINDAYTAAEEVQLVKYIKAIKDYYSARGMDFILYSANSYSIHQEFIDEVARQNIKAYFYMNKLPNDIAGYLEIAGDGHPAIGGSYLRALTVAEFLKQNGY